MADIFFHRKTLHTLRWAVRARWVIVLGAILILMGARILGLGQGLSVFTNNVVLFLVLFSATYNTVFWWYLNKKHTQSLTGLHVVTVSQLILDQIFYSGAVYLTGGIETQAFMFYTLSIILAAILFRGWPVVLFGLSAGLMYINVILLEYFEILPHVYRYDFDTGIYGNPLITFINGAAVVLLLLLVSFFSAFVSVMIRDREDSIIQEQDRVSSIFRSFIDGLILVDNSDKVSLVNPIAETMLGVRTQELLGRTAGKQHNQERLRVFDDIVSHPVRLDEQTGQFGTFEYELKEPQKIFLQISTVLVKDARGESMGKMKVLHDITREKAIDVLKSEFISVAAHQLRTPLSAIKWVIKLLMDGDAGAVNDEQKTLLGKGFESNERMIRLVNDLLNVSRIEEGRFQYKFAVGSIREMMDSVVEELQPSIKERKIDFKMVYDQEKLPDIRFDGSKLRLAVQNLIDNASRYTPEGGKVTVTVSYDADKQQMRIAVADTGVGIPKDQQEKMFTKFFRADNVVRMQTDGSGLGLFIVKNIVTKHDGQVSFVSEPEKGTTFTIQLPTVAAAPARKKNEFDDFMQEL